MIVDQYDSDEETGALQCRRYPPGVMWEPNVEQMMRIFPQVSGFDWCGEWVSDGVLH